MTTLAFEMGYKLERQSIYRVAIAAGRNILLKFLVEFSLALILNFAFIERLFLRYTIRKLTELVLYLKGFGEVVRKLPIEIVISEYQKLSKVLPVYHKLDIYFSNLKKKDPLVNGLAEVIHQIVCELESIEATLEIYSDASDVEDLKEIEDDIMQNKVENFSPWHS